MSRRALPILLLAFALIGAPAQAATSTKKAIWGPVTVGGQSQFPIYADLGVGIFQDGLPWDAVARPRRAAPADPADPAYEWPPERDLARAECAKYGIRGSLSCSGAPRWANGGR